jgi:DNA polymerase-1
VSTGDRLVLVDGNALVYRSFFAIPPHLTTKEGLHTNAVFGFASTFKKLFAGKRPAFGAVVFDAPGRTHRDELYPQYKAQRPPMPDDLAAQLPHIERVVRANHFPVLRVPGVEADDVIGTLTRMGRERGLDVVIVSADKDFAQLVTDGVRLSSKNGA